MSNFATTRETWGPATTNLVLSRLDSDIRMARNSRAEGLLDSVDFVALCYRFTEIARDRLAAVEDVAS